jgi:hypothetical protein
VLRGFLGNATVFMKLLKPLIAAVSQAPGLRRERHTARFEQREVVGLPRSKRHRKNPLALEIDDQLRLLGVPLLLSGVALSLPFLGRSTGLSVTSTTTTSISVSESVSVFLPGR